MASWFLPSLRKGPDGRVAHGAVDLDVDGFAGVLGRKVQVPPVPADALAGQPPLAATHGRVGALVKGALDGPVVGQVQGLPGAVVKLGLGELGRRRLRALGGPLGVLGRVHDKVVGRRQDEGLERRVGQPVRVGREAAEAPAGIEALSRPLLRRGGVAREERQAEEEGAC
ncbi:hypothetical protein MCOR04_008408 [Pyricularia oryzae]|nr:hypothetical protein MCOR04_008408 [Pyricularia oryzae]